jgi:uncharacterized membrane-anchored protein YhcB (DUF1043 family)
MSPLTSVFSTFVKVLGVVIVVIIGVSAGEIAKTAFKKNQQEKEDSRINSRMVKVSTELNSQLPKMIDSETRFDTTSVMGKQLHQKYTLVNSRVADLDKPLLHEKMESALKEI